MVYQVWHRLWSYQVAVCALYITEYNVFHPHRELMNYKWSPQHAPTLLLFPQTTPLILTA